MKSWLEGPKSMAQGSFDSSAGSVRPAARPLATRLAVQRPAETAMPQATVVAVTSESGRLATASGRSTRPQAASRTASKEASWHRWP